MPYLFIPLILLVVAALVWSWWTARADRDPASSVGSFNRALSAMQPGDRGPAQGPGGDGPSSSGPRADDAPRDA